MAIRHHTNKTFHAVELSHNSSVLSPRRYPLAAPSLSMFTITLANLKRNVPQLATRPFPHDRQPTPEYGHFALGNRIVLCLDACAYLPFALLDPCAPNALPRLT